jgi:hypothetical protein
VSHVFIVDIILPDCCGFDSLNEMSPTRPLVWCRELAYGNANPVEA